MSNQMAMVLLWPEGAFCHPDFDTHWEEAQQAAAIVHRYIGPQGIIRAVNAPNCVAGGGCLRWKEAAPLRQINRWVRVAKKN